MRFIRNLLKVRMHAGFIIFPSASVTREVDTESRPSNTRILPHALIVGYHDLNPVKPCPCSDAEREYRLPFFILSSSPAETPQLNACLRYNHET